MSFLNEMKGAIRLKDAREYTRAFNLLEKAKSSAGSDRVRVKIIMLQIWCLHCVGNVTEAESMTIETLNEFQQEPQAYLCGAKYYMMTNRLKSAKNLLQKGLELFPNILEIYLTLASILKDTNRSNEAIEILKKALNREDLTRGKGISRKDIWAELGSLQFERGNLNAALACLKKSMAISGEEEFYHYDLIAQCYLNLSDPENALKFIDIHLQHFPETIPQDYILKARAYARLGKETDASLVLMQAYQIEDCLNLTMEDLADFSILVKNGFFQKLDHVNYI